MVPREAKDLYELVRKVRQERNQLEGVWKVNLAFYKGRHYTYYNPGNNRVQELPEVDRSSPRYRVRLMNNQITPSVQSLIAKMTKTKPVLHARSQNSDIDSVQATSVAENLLEHFESHLKLPKKKAQALTWSLIAGNGYAWLYWDSDLGGDTIMVDPSGQPIADSLTRTNFQESLKAANIPVDQFFKKIDQGDVGIKIKSPFDIFVDPAASSFEDADYIIVCDRMTPADLKARYPQLKDAQPDTKVEPPDNQLNGSGPKLNKAENDAIDCFYAYWKPGGSYGDQGRYCIFTKTDKLYDGNWPFKTIVTYPIVGFDATPSPDSIYCRGLVEDAIPLQKDLNRTLSQIVEHKNLTVNPRWLVPVGGFRTPMTNESGGLIEFNPVGNFKPEPVQMPPLQPYVYEHLNELTNRVKDAFYLAEVDAGQVPPNVEAGISIDMLQEMSTDRIAPLVESYENSLCALASLLIKFASEFYSARKIVKIVGESNTKKVEAFKRAETLEIVGETGSGLPRTRAGRTARAIQMLNLGILTPGEAWKYFDNADMRSFADERGRDEDQALSEHELLAAGQPVNVIAMQAAMQQIQQMMSDPSQLDPSQPPPDPNAILQDASLEPTEFEDYPTHLRIHSSFMKTPQFRAMPPEIQSAFNTHFTKTMAKFAQMQASAPEPPRVSYQFRSAMGAATAAAGLQASGVQIDAETIANDPPLDTVVFDSLDKPNAPKDDNGETFMNLAAQSANVDLLHEKAKLVAAQTKNVGKQQPSQG